MQANCPLRDNSRTRELSFALMKQESMSLPIVHGDQNTEKASCWSSTLNQWPPIQKQTRWLRVGELALGLWLGPVSEVVWWISHAILSLHLVSKTENWKHVENTYGYETVKLSTLQNCKPDASSNLPQPEELRPGNCCFPVELVHT